MNKEIREGLENIADLLKQLTEEITQLSQCFHECDENDEEGEKDKAKSFIVEEEEAMKLILSFEEAREICDYCERYMTCSHLHDNKCEIMIAKAKSSMF